MSCASVAMVTPSLSTATALLMASWLLLRPVRKMYLFHFSPVMASATDTASAQGWRRPVLAWLLLQSKSAQSAGDADEVARLQRRIAIVEYGAMPESKP